MLRCPACGARREESDDYCPVCGETLTQVHFSEATGPPWYERRGLLLGLVVVFWPLALYGIARRDRPSRGFALVLLAGCAAMALVWASMFGLM